MIYTLLLAAHLWCMNIASAAPLFAVWLNVRGRRPAGVQQDAAMPIDSGFSDEARRLAVVSVLALNIGILAGLLVGTVSWWQGDTRLLQIVPSFMYKVRWAVSEIVFYLVCMLLFLAVHRRSFRGVRTLQGSLAFLASTNLLYHFPPLFIVMSQAAKTPSSISENVGPEEFRRLMMQGHVAALSVHFALASFAVVAVDVLNRCVNQLATHEPPVLQQWQKAARVAGGIALIVTAAQMLVGVWLLMRLEPLMRRAVMGGDVVKSCLLGISVTAAFGLLHLLAASTFGELSVRQSRLTRLLLIAIVVMMTGLLA